MWISIHINVLWLGIFGVPFNGYTFIDFQHRLIKLGKTLHTEVKYIWSCLVDNLQDISKTCRCYEGYASCLSFEESISGDGRAHAYRLEWGYV